MSAQEEITKVFEEFKSANDERLDSIEKSISKTADGMATEKVKALETAVFEKLDEQGEAVKAAEKRAEQAEVAAKRRAFTGSDEINVKGEHLREMARRVGSDVSPEEFVEAKSQFAAWLRKGQVGEWVGKAMSVGSDPDGGYLVMPDTTGRIVQFVRETSPIRAVASAQTISSDALEGSYDLDEADAGWVSERGARSETGTPGLGRWRIPVHEIYAAPRITQKLLDDAEIDVEAWISGKVGDRFSRKENAAFVNGDGDGKPRGFLTYSHGTPAGSSTAAYRVIERIATGASGAFNGTDPGDALYDVAFALKAQFRQRAVWMMNRATLAEVLKLKDGDGSYLWQPDFQASGIGIRLIGQPVVEGEDMPDIAADSLSIAFGDFAAGYQIVDRAGIRVLRDPYSNKPEVEFYTTKRTGGDVVGFEAIKLLRFASAAS